MKTDNIPRRKSGAMGSDSIAEPLPPEAVEYAFPDFPDTSRRVELTEYWRRLVERVRDREEFAYANREWPRRRNEWEHPEQAYRRGYKQGVEFVLIALRKAEAVDARTLRALERYLVRVCDWRWLSRHRLERQLHRDAAPVLELKRRSRR